MKKIYFGHPVCFFDETIEEYLISKIEVKFPEFEIENPNNPFHKYNYFHYKEKYNNGMKYYFEKVLPKMSIGVFMPFEDQMFGAGVYGEAEWMKKEGKEIYQIDFDGIISKLSLDESLKLSIEDTLKRVHRD